MPKPTAEMLPTYSARQNRSTPTLFQYIRALQISTVTGETGRSLAFADPCLRRPRCSLLAPSARTRAPLALSLCVFSPDSSAQSSEDSCRLAKSREHQILQRRDARFERRAHNHDTSCDAIATNVCASGMLLSSDSASEHWAPTPAHHLPSRLPVLAAPALLALAPYCQPADRSHWFASWSLVCLDRKGR